VSSEQIRQILNLSLEHIVLVLSSIATACAIAIPGAIVLSREPGPRRAAIALTNILQTIPSLALFGFLIPIPFIGGIGKRTAIVALVV
jgi:osmoprotectant transport system permease protein